MCDYQGYQFGAGRYPDSVCIDGKLHDADHCDGQGNIYLNEEDIPCPICRPQEAIAWWFEQWKDMSEVGDDREWDAINAEHQQRAVSLVNDIRANRGLAAAA
ncbi:MAG TPA: hypothetical protein VN624_19510 [Rhodanobacter sp.]|nr:hypothetical protein [Rhodanobacter sp.]